MRLFTLVAMLAAGLSLPRCVYVPPLWFEEEEDEDDGCDDADDDDDDDDDDNDEDWDNN